MTTPPLKTLLNTACIAGTILSVAILVSGCGKSAPQAGDTAPKVRPVEAPQPEPAPDLPPTVVIDTSMGSIEVTLWPDKAPGTVSNFLAYVDSGFYDALIFHRVIKGFMVQGGGFESSMKQKAAGTQIKNEASVESPNNRGTIAMARTSDVDSATAQFFINLVNNDFLNHRDATPRGFGYCAFGEVTAGMDVVDAIGSVATGRKGMMENVPNEAVIIKTIRLK
ncbi:MAG: peptidylprolyl isomerase [Lentisphaerae bacterium]|nr:peptidylprolyl isomerase [Lentisphaerota bacterium]